MSKFLKTSSAIAVAAISQLAMSAPYDGTLAGFDNSTDSGGAQTASVAIALAANPDLRDALQVAEFGAGSVCVGNTTKLCMPSLSSAEVRLLLTNSAVDLRTMTNAGNNPSFSDYSFTGPQCTVAEPRDGDMWEVARCVVGGVLGPFIDRYVADEAKVAAESFADANDCGGSAEILTDGTSASVLSTVAGVTTRHAFAAVPVTEISGASVGFVKLDGQAPDLANYESGNYGFGSNVLGTGALPASFAGPFGTVGVAEFANLGNATPFNQNAGLVAGDCESLYVGSAVVD